MSDHTLLDFPADLLPDTWSWGLQRFDGAFVSPLSGTTQVMRRGARWKCDMNWNDLGPDEAQPLGAFFSQLADLSNLVLVRDYGYTQRGTLSGSPAYYRKAGDMDSAWIASHAYTSADIRLDTNGNVQSVVTGGTSGSSPPTWNTTVGGSTPDGGVTWNNLGAWSLGTLVGTGATASASGILLAGDKIQMTTNQLVEVTDSSVSADASGHFLAHVAPDIRSEPPHLSALGLTDPSCYMQLTSPAYKRTVTRPALSALAVSFIEVIP